MAATPPTIGPYIVDREIGRGGMGVVYLAKDQRLDRLVAVKAIPPELASDGSRLVRFQREARSLALASHPNIAIVHGFEDYDGSSFLVMEYVEGETLAEKLVRGPLSVEDALRVCAQVASGLEAAHEASVIHRDLKPGNIKLTLDGKAKILDFGLARDLRPEEARGAGRNGPLTEEGVILGTPGYMSPEQVRGKPVDRRADIFAFGCLLYTCLVGTPAFSGETPSDVIVAILDSEPDLTRLPGKTPPRVRELIGKCLVKDPAHRLRDIGDARIELERAILNKEWSTAFFATIPGRHRRSSMAGALAPWIVGGLLGAGAAATVATFIARGSETAASPDVGLARAVTKFVVNPPGLPATGEFDTTATLAISSDGRRVAFVARDPVDQQARLYVRDMAGVEATVVSGSEHAHDPCFSPDGEWLLFVADDRLWKELASGGPRIELNKLPGFHKGSTWGASGILCSPAPSAGLSRLSADGGELTSVTEPDASRNEVSYRWPELLPDGRHVLCTVKKRGIASFDEAEIAVCSLDTYEWKTVLRGGFFARYAGSGHLVFARGSDLMAVPFDLERLEVTGQGISVVSGVMTEPTSGAAQFAMSSNGTLVFAPGGRFEPLLDPVWVQRDGTTTPVGLPPRPYRWPVLSPDGKRLAVIIAGATDAIFVYDFARGTLTRATDDGNSSSVSWTPDGENLVYNSDRESGGTYRSRADGSGKPDKLLPFMTKEMRVVQAGPNQALLYAKGTGGQRDIWMCPLEAGATGGPLVASRFDEWSPSVSPDGKWLAYVSNESGRQEVYVGPFPTGAGRWQISKDGADRPTWSADGTRIHFLLGSVDAVGQVNARRTIVSVSVSTLGGFDVGPVQSAFQWDGLGEAGITPDGERILTLHRLEESRPSREIHAVLNWFDELRTKVPLKPR